MTVLRLQLGVQVRFQEFEIAGIRGLWLSNGLLCTRFPLLLKACKPDMAPRNSPPIIRVLERII